MTAFPLASIPDTEVRTLWSSVVGEEYLISVAFPFHYADHPEQRYPVIFVLDGNFTFGLATEMVRMMNLRVPFCNELPDALIVGIGYPLDGSVAEVYNQVAHRRLRDFLSVADSAAEKAMQDAFPIANPLAAGGADRFLQFIVQELLPFIEDRYRADSADRTLLGMSWGGTFALYVLFHQPQLFQRYVAASPDLAGNNESTLAYARDAVQLPASRPIRLHIAYGEREWDDAYRQRYLAPLVSVLESRRDEGLTLTQQIVPNGTHCAVAAPAFQAGLVAVFA